MHNILLLTVSDLFSVLSHLLMGRIFLRAGLAWFYFTYNCLLHDYNVMQSTHELD